MDPINPLAEFRASVAHHNFIKDQWLVDTQQATQNLQPEDTAKPHPGTIMVVRDIPNQHLYRFFQRMKWMSKHNHNHELHKDEVTLRVILL